MYVIHKIVIDYYKFTITKYIQSHLYIYSAHDILLHIHTRYWTSILPFNILKK